MKISSAGRVLTAGTLVLVGASVLLGQPVSEPAVDGAAAGVPAKPGATSESGPAAQTISLQSLGLEDGIAFSELDGRTDLQFVVPAGSWLAGARLVLPYRAWAVRPTARTLTIMDGEQVLAQVPIEDGEGRVEIPIPPAAYVGGNLPISLIYSGGLTPDRCAEGRLAADHLLFDPSGGLELTPVPNSVPPIAASVATLGMKPFVVLPPRPTEEQAAAALTIVAARGGAVLSNETRMGPGVIQTVSIS